MEKRQQVIDQCSAVNHMATCIALVYGDHARMLYRSGCAPTENADEILIDLIGKRTASLMETLGDILNGMDAVTKDDEWLTPIFERAQKMWTVTR